MKKIKKKIQNTFKIIFYKAYLLLYGKINGKINFKNDSRVKTKIVEKENNLKYRVFNIENGRLYTDRVHDAAVILDNSVVDGPSYQLRTINNAKVEENIVFQKGTPRIKKFLNGKVLSLLTGGAGNENYFHWIFDVLPRLALIEKLVNFDEINFFLLPSTDKKFQIESLDLLNISKAKCISSKDYRHILCSELFVTDHPYVVTNDASNDIQNIPIWISDWLKKKYIKSTDIEISKFPKKIFIDRSDSSANTKGLRLITNENEVKNFLIDKGFEPVVLGNFHFKEQIEIFNNAEIIVGLHGSGFANLSFCKPGTKVIELKSQTAGKVIEHLALTNQLIYKSISCEATKFKGSHQFGHIEVSINLLEEIINSFIK